jgi:hypothetical protein
MKMKHFIVLLYVIIFLDYFTLPDNDFLKIETCCNIIYSKVIQNIFLINCFYFTIFLYI